MPLISIYVNTSTILFRNLSCLVQLAGSYYLDSRIKGSFPRDGQLQSNLVSCVHFSQSPTKPIRGLQARTDNTI